jgi:hypothetical protein
MSKKSAPKKRRSSKDLRADMWIAPDIRRIIIGEQDERYSVADQFPGASNRMLDLADLALGVKPPSKQSATPVIEKEQVFSAAAGSSANQDPLPMQPKRPVPVVTKSRTRG